MFAVQSHGADADLAGMASGMRPGIRAPNSAGLGPLLLVGLVAAARLQDVVGTRDADTTYPIRFAADVARGGARGWVVPPTPYFFPDVGVVLPLQALGGPVFAYGAYSVLVAFAVYALVTRINRMVAPARPPATHRWAAALAVALIAIPRLSAFRFSVDIYRSLTSPAVHGGAALVALWAVTFTNATLVEERWSRRRLATLGLVMAAATASDVLAFAHSAIPVAFLVSRSFSRSVSRTALRGGEVTTAKGWIWSQRKPVAWASVYVMSVCAGIASTQVLPLVGIRKFSGVGPRLDAGGLLRLLGDSAWWLREHPAWAVSGVICSYGAIRIRTSGRRWSPMAAALLVLVASTSLTTALLGFREPADARRMLLVFVVPMVGAAGVVTPLALKSASWLRSQRVRLLPVAGLPNLVRAGVYGIALSVAVIRPGTTQKPRLAADISKCVDQLRGAGLVHAGLGSFWSVGELDVGSKTGAPTASIDVEARTWLALRNVSNLLVTADSGTLEGEPVDYVLPDYVRQRSILDSYGAPAVRYRCENGAQVWIYPRAQLAPAVRALKRDAARFMQNGEAQREPAAEK